ncbi:MAG: DUF3179 domain-containing protein [Cyanobacteria bacterium P01_H01_bin.121]
MRRWQVLGLGGISSIGLILGGLVFRADGWDNFKLQSVAWTQHWRDQSQELGDLQAQNIEPEAYSRIKLAELLNGGPPKDGIPSLDQPQFDTAAATPFADDETVIGVVINGEAKAYPYGIMNWHEIVNDTVGGVNVTITYCPLCDTIVAFERGQTTFGVSGKLYQSCLIMYDRADDTLYAQPWALGVVGPAVNESLERIPAVKTTLGAWLAEHPDSKVLSPETGYSRDYFRYPYGTYYTDDRLIFPVRHTDQLQQHPKEIVSYIWDTSEQTPHNQFAGESLAFVHSEVQQQQRIRQTFREETITAQWDDDLQTVVITDEQGELVPSSTAFAFVYPAFFAGVPD